MVFYCIGRDVLGGLEGLLQHCFNLVSICLFVLKNVVPSVIKKIKLVSLIMIILIQG